MKDRPRYYVERGGKAEPVDDPMTWAREFEKFREARRVGYTVVMPPKATLTVTGVPGEVTVSTVFLGLDHNFRDEGPPLIYETMVFGGPLDQETERYSTREEAAAGHERMVERCKEQ